LRLKLEHRHALGAGRDESLVRLGVRLLGADLVVVDGNATTPASRVSRSTPWLPPTVYNDPGDHMIEVTAAPTSRAGLGTSTVDGAWNASMAGYEITFEAVAASSWSTNPGEVAGGERRLTR